MISKNKRNNFPNDGKKHGHSLPEEINKENKELTESAHNEAEKDIENDAELSKSSPNDDLDEGESALLGDDMDLI